MPVGLHIFGQLGLRLEIDPSLLENNENTLSLYKTPNNLN